VRSVLNLRGQRGDRSAIFASLTIAALPSGRWMEVRNPGDGERWTLFASVTEPSQLV
jgi:hypothetical protein